MNKHDLAETFDKQNIEKQAEFNRFGNSNRLPVLPMLGAAAALVAFGAFANKEEQVTLQPDTVPATFTQTPPSNYAVNLILNHPR